MYYPWHNLSVFLCFSCIKSYDYLILFPYLFIHFACVPKGTIFISLLILLENVFILIFIGKYL